MIRFVKPIFYFVLIITAILGTHIYAYDHQEERDENQSAKQARETNSTDDLKSLNKAARVKLEWMKKFTLLDKDYVTLTCYDDALFWPFFKGDLLSEKLRQDISAVVKNLANLDTQTVDAQAVVSLNSKTMRQFDFIMKHLNMAYAHIIKKKGNSLAMVRAIKKCGALRIVLRSNNRIDEAR